jgi:hypothetical protein
MVNQTLRSRRSQIESKGKSLAKGCPCCIIWAAFLSNGRLSMLGTWRPSRITSNPSRFLVLQSSAEALSSLFSSWLLSSSELRSLEEELDEDDEDEESFENLEEVSAIDPSAIINSFLDTDFKRSQVHLQACTESLVDLSDGVPVPPAVIFWLLEEILSYPFYGLLFLFFVCSSRSVG